MFTSILAAEDGNWFSQYGMFIIIAVVLVLMIVLTVIPQKKRQKQQQEMIENFAAALVELKEAIDAAEREYWRKWAEESTRQFAETILRQCERRYGRKEELQQPTT